MPGDGEWGWPGRPVAAAAAAGSAAAVAAAAAAAHEPAGPALEAPAGGSVDKKNITMFS